MTVHPGLDPRPVDPATQGIIKLALLAVGGQGGGVLTGWIEDLARANGYAAQATSVAGVAQRTGATVYYVEMAPAAKGTPVFSLMPSAGDVDIMITAELMEAGRSIIRGFVTPDRTTLITSTHRSLAVSEKTVPGDGIADGAEVLAAAEVAARRLIAADFDALAIAQGSVISASLFGALAAAEVLPFPREAFEAAIAQGGKGVEPSLKAFAAGYEAARTGAAQLVPSKSVASGDAPKGPARLLAEWATLTARVDRLPAPVAELARPGLRKVVDFQDIAYGRAYLDRLDQVLTQDRAPFALTREAAKHLANAMAYDDIIRVANEKTRATRMSRIAGEMGAQDKHLLHVTEFLHPRAEELVSLLPARMGARWAANPRRMALVDRLFNKGRRLRTDSLRGFLMLHVLGGLKGWRLKSLRHATETAHREAWLATALAYLPQNYDLAVEVIRCRRLVKGYSDTHARGLSKFDRVLAAIALVKDRDDAALWAARLREAALRDEEGKALDGAIATIRSFL
ncbi:indolepyruvate oxidoreductase subunit beta family protein [Tabrizicola sp.]|uniref:indolepyruvate oxidoreductase subunit beta family protein n=1 Tax=Tabrizicola sp. TaxID=2005166 RepID=UPI001A541F8A|nr:indolepyruvate oxidoreductase subunit beta family protein [Tabrizicola sp.]MBL9072777.1 indolepyruvate oxidoreductase subunit beta family protein [Tabrizicola sp.]